MARVNYRIDPNRDFEKSRTPHTFETNIYKPIGKGWINFKGYFSLEMLYKRVYEYLSGEIGYLGPKGDDMFETYFFENRGADGSIKEIWFWWRAHKVPDGNPMFKYRLNLEFQILGLKSETIVVDGQKVKQEYGELSFFIAPWLDFELKNKGKSMLSKGDAWGSDALLKPFNSWFEKRVYEPQIADRKNELYAHANAVVGCVKNFLGLAGYQGFRMDFHPPKGIPQSKL